MDSFIKVPEIWSFMRNGKTGKNVYPVTVTLNVKNPQYRAINCPNEFKSLLNSFLDLKQYKHHVNGVLEYHKPNGTFRKGGLHMHGFVYNRNPPKDNYNNLFHFHIVPADEVKGIKGYALYSAKAIKETDAQFKKIASTPAEPVFLFGDSPTIRTSKCLFDD